jgi:transposase-like protein
MIEIKEFTSLFDLLKKFSDEETCIKHLESLRWGREVVSPFDPESTVYKSKNHRYKCRNSNKYFNVRTGTIFEDSKVPLQKWFMAIYLAASHKKGISSHQLAKDIDVTQKTAWFMLHRIRYAFDHQNFKDKMGEHCETVEADEAYIGGKLKNKHAKERRELHAKGDDNKTPVVGIIERGYNKKTVVAKKVENTTAIEVAPIIQENVSKKAWFVSDGAKIYEAFGHNFTKHIIVNHHLGEYTRSIFHTNNIENFWSILKRGVYGIYHHVSPEHLQQYLNEFAFRYNTKDCSESERFNLYLKQTGRRLKYKDLIEHE